MLGNFEKRHFADGEKVWLGRYQGLTNVLHWHCECELICVAAGHAQIKIGNFNFNATAGDVFFCIGEELHYIAGTPDSKIDIAIFDQSITKDILRHWKLVNPQIPHSCRIQPYLEKLRQVLTVKGVLYREALDACARGLITDIFRSCEITQWQEKPSVYNDLISKINDEFAFITFSDAVRYCGYSPSHFSKVFRALSGMTFSDYLNIIRIEHAIAMMKATPNATIASISSACGFSTIRNFNRVFRMLTGCNPRKLPEDFRLDTNLRISGAAHFDPTQKSSKLL